MAEHGMIRSHRGLLGGRSPAGPGAAGGTRGPRQESRLQKGARHGPGKISGELRTASRGARPCVVAYVPAGERGHAEGHARAAAGAGVEGSRGREPRALAAEGPSASGSCQRPRQRKRAFD